MQLKGNEVPADIKGDDSVSMHRSKARSEESLNGKRRTGAKLPSDNVLVSNPRLELEGAWPRAVASTALSTVPKRGFKVLPDRNS